MKLFSFAVSLVALLGCTAMSAGAAIHVTAPTRFVETGGVRFAYRSFGAASGTSVVFLNHSRGTLDTWDPLLVDAVAKTRPVVLFDNAGVGASTGATPDTFAGMARDAIAFLHALKLEQVDLLGFSIGGCVAQEIALQEPALVRRLILAATAPQGGEDILLTGRAREMFLHPPSPAAATLFLFFSPSDTSQTAGREFLVRRALRPNPVPAVTEACGKAQRAARDAWGQPNPALYARLKGITQPVLVANGNADLMMQTKNSSLLFQQLPNATLLLYPDSGHGFLFQYAERFAQDVADFLDRS